MFFIQDNKENEEVLNMSWEVPRFKSSIKSADQRKPRDGRPLSARNEVAVSQSAKRSAEVQASALKEWLNLKLTGVAYGDESLSLSGYGAVLMSARQAETHNSALALYQGKFSEAARAVEAEVSSGRIAVREDRDVLLDVAIKDGLLEVLLSYEPHWLKLGLEAVFDGILSPSFYKSGISTSQKTPCVWQSVLKAFISDRVLNDPVIAATYCTSKLMSAQKNREMKSALKNHTVKTVLLLVLFLDLARESRVLPCPTLFRKDRGIRSTASALAAFCRHFIRGEGDIVRHLVGIGCRVSFSQSFVHEFAFTVADPGLDMRDGVRLCRLVEVLTDSETLCDKLRVPAISRLQKLHNVGLALQRLGARHPHWVGEARDVVDGTAKGLDLLWQIVAEFELPTLINSSAVLLEAMRVRSNAGWRRTVYPAEVARSLAVKVPFRADGTLKVMSSQPTYASLSSARACEETGVRDALLEWCDSIAAQFGISVLGLDEDLSDGKVLCLLMHYYHPALLPIAQIARTTHDVTTLDDTEMQRGVDGERRNFALLRRVCATVGGIPELLPKMSSRLPLDERVSVLLLSFMFARIVALSRQVLACIRIQRAVRLHILGGRLMLYPVLAAHASLPAKPKRASLLSSIMRKTSEISVTVALSKKQRSVSTIVRAMRRHLIEKHRLLERADKRGGAEDLADYVSKEVLHSRKLVATATETVRRFVRTFLTERRRQRLHVNTEPVESKNSEPLRGITTLQAIVRGVQARSGNKNGVARVRARLACTANISHTLGHRTASALEAITQDVSLPDRVHAYQTLELSTAMSKECCRGVAQASAAAALFRFIRGCNRSEGHQDLLRQALAILLNVARIDDLAVAVSEAPDSAETLIDLMQMFRDKPAIFCLASELICRLVRVDLRTKACCASAEVRKRLSGILSILERKRKLDARVRRLSSESTIKGSPRSPSFSRRAHTDPLDSLQVLFSLLQTAT